MKAVKHFKKLIEPTKVESPVMQSILGQEHESYFVEPPMEMEPEESFRAEFNKSHSMDMYNPRRPGRDLVLNGYHKPQQDSDNVDSNDLTTPLSESAAAKPAEGGVGTRGHARDPLDEDFPYLFIGPSTFTGSNDKSDLDSIAEDGNDTPQDDNRDNNTTYNDDDDDLIVSESPAVAEFDIYETAYRQQIENIRKRSLTRRGTTSKVYLTRRVEGKDHVKKLVEGMPQQDAAPDHDDNNGSESFPKRKVTPITHTVGLMKAQLERHRQRSLQASGQGQGQN